MSQFAYHIRPGGDHQPIKLENLTSAPLQDGFLWVNLDPQDEACPYLLKKLVEIDSATSEALFNNSLRPRLELNEDDIYLSVRGVNLRETDCPEDMVNLRILVTPHALLTFHTRDLVSVATLKSQIDKKQTFSSQSSLLARLISLMIELIGNEIEDIADLVTKMEEQSLSDNLDGLQDDLSPVRRSLLGFQKHLQPQANILHRLCEADSKWVKKRERTLLKNMAEKLSTQVGELDHLRQRTTVLQEEIKSAQTEKMNNTMYRLTIVATLMLPLSLFAGLMGANVGGIPFAENPYGFFILCLISLGIGLGVYLGLKKLKWI
ncbi:zinc transporter ZntB [Terasakiella brassicae]|uniref:Zinc transporter ZntB n=1 Tax=Terasakiella brassicae TaxID=1634917 RepID=A0A917F8Y1_9PROT|nr:CorA family divalent cation transporter [Terasakiella brassicae]GGF61006.1 zinc transporter ZntB [Terasakiella brassicae]